MNTIKKTQNWIQDWLDKPKRSCPNPTGNKKISKGLNKNRKISFQDKLDELFSDSDLFSKF